MDQDLIAYVRDYAKLDDEETDASVWNLIEAARQYLRQAGVPGGSLQEPLYQLCLAAVVLDLHDNRSGETALKSGNVRMLINQLKLDAMAASAYARSDPNADQCRLTE